MVSHSQFLHPRSCAIAHSHTHTHTSSHFTHIHTHTHLYHATQVLIVTRSHTRSLSLHVFMPALIHTPTCLHAYPYTLLTTYTHSVRPTTRSHKFTFTNGYSHFLTCTFTTSLTHMHSFALTRSFSLTHASAHTPPHPSQTLMLSLSLLHSSWAYSFAFWCFEYIFNNIFSWLASLYLFTGSLFLPPTCSLTFSHSRLHAHPLHTPTLTCSTLSHSQTFCWHSGSHFLSLSLITNTYHTHILFKPKLGTPRYVPF